MSESHQTLASISQGQPAGLAIDTAQSSRRGDNSFETVLHDSFLKGYDSYRFSGGVPLIGAENVACASGSTGLCLILVFAGSFPRKLSPFQFFDGLIGRGTNPPPQFGHTFPRM
jgi:hypothetical protein